MHGKSVNLEETPTPFLGAGVGEGSFDHQEQGQQLSQLPDRVQSMCEDDWVGVSKGADRCLGWPSPPVCLFVEGPGIERGELDAAISKLSLQRGA